MKFIVSSGRKFHSDHVGAALLQRGVLQRVITANPPFAYKRQPSLEGYVTHTLPYYIPGLILSRIPALRKFAPEFDWWATRRFDHDVASRLSNADVLYAFAWSARRSFERAHALGIRCLLEECGSANLYQDTLLSEEYRSLGIPYRDPIASRVIANERIECELADIILCPSEYVANSLSVYSIPRSKCLVIPYATNPKFLAHNPKPPSPIVHILFVGSVSVRKGIIYLLQALKILNDSRVVCTVIGRIDPVLAPLLHPYTHLFKHISSVPHQEMPAYFASADVFVLPTLDEGMALVVMEALASGTPVITTPNSGAEDFVKDGRNGFIVPIRNPQAIADAVNKFLTDPQLLPSFSEEALASAIKWSWDDFAQKLIQSLATD